MSNLYKQRYAISDQGNTRVIDSNDKIAAKMRELSVQAAKQAVRDDEEFTEGLVPERVEIIPDAEPQENMDEIRLEANQLIEEAREQARQLVEQAEARVEEIETQAHKEGYQRGYEEGNEKAEAEMEDREEAVLKKAEALEADYQRERKLLEPELVNVVSSIFEKVFHVYFDDKKEVLLYLVERAVLSIENTKEFQIRVGEENFRFMETHKSEIEERVGQNVSIEILPDAQLKENQCIIETDSGVFDCSLGVQLENLIKTLRTLSLQTQ